MSALPLESVFHEAKFTYTRHKQEVELFVCYFWLP